MNFIIYIIRNNPYLPNFNITKAKIIELKNEASTWAKRNGNPDALRVQRNDTFVKKENRKKKIHPRKRQRETHG